MADKLQERAFEHYRRIFIKRTASVLGGIAALGILFAVFKFTVSKKFYGRSKLRLKRAFGSESNNGDRLNNIIEPMRTQDGNYEIKKSIFPQDSSIFMSLSGMPTIAIWNGSKIRVFSAKCTHLGCIVKWDSVQRRFKCPCHQGEYDENGSVIGGPPPLKLKEYQVNNEDSKIIIMNDV